MLQMCIPELRANASQRLFNQELAQYDYDLPAWRNSGSPRARSDFSLLDRNNGAGWDLACRLVRQRDQYFRGRLSVEEALNHRFFRGD